MRIKLVSFLILVALPPVTWTDKKDNAGGQACQIVVSASNNYNNTNYNPPWQQKWWWSFLLFVECVVCCQSQSIRWWLGSPVDRVGFGLVVVLVHSVHSIPTTTRSSPHYLVMALRCYQTRAETTRTRPKQDYRRQWRTTTSTRSKHVVGTSHGD